LSTSRITKLALIAAATAVATIAVPATARADVIKDSYIFQSPSGNIGCEMQDRDDGTGVAVCKIHDRTWLSPPPGGDCRFAGQDLILYRSGVTDQSPAACVGVYPSQIWLALDYNKVTLAYGQTHSVGPFTCESEPSGVTCTDNSTGHFFRVSRESYDVG
jgi:hypothetical protein